MIKILIVEDNLDMQEIYREVLEDNGYTCVLSGDGLEALKVLENESIDLILLDIMMPNMGGYEFMEDLRNAQYNIPTIMVTAKNQFQDMEQGFVLGADDYLTKPVNVNELLLRISALLRRSKISSDKKIVVGNTILDYDSLTVIQNDKEEVLPKKEFYLLYKLISYPNKTFTRHQLMDEIWGIFSDSDERTVNTHINRLRERFKDCEDFEILTIRGLGYKVIRHEK